MILFKSSKWIQNSIWLMLLQALNTLVPVITLPYITRVLAPEGYGSFSLALNWILYLQVLVEYGFGFLGARKVATYGENRLQAVYSVIITARIMLLLAAFLLLNAAYFLSGMPKTHYICMLVLFSMVIGTAFQLTWLFQGKQDMHLTAMVNAVSRVLSAALVFLLVKGKEHLYLYCFLHSCTYLFSSIIGLIAAKRTYGLKIRLAPLGEAASAIREGCPLFLSQAMSKILSGFGVTVLGAVAASSIVGIYSAIYKIPGIMTQFFYPIGQALYPSMSIAFEKSEAEGLHQVKRLGTVISAMFAVSAVLLIILRRQIVNLLFGREYAQYSDAVIPLCLWLVLGIVNHFLGIQTLVASGHQKEYARSFSVSAILAVTLNIALGKAWGIFGVAWAAFLAELVLSFVLMRTIRKCFANPHTVRSPVSRQDTP